MGEAFVSERGQKTSTLWIFVADAAFVVVAQNHLRHVKGPKPHQLELWVMEQEKPQAQSDLCHPSYQIIRRLQRIREGTHLLLFFLSIAPSSSAPCHVSLSSCERQRKGDGEAHTSSYAKPVSTSFRVMCLCSPEFPLMLNNEVRPPCF